MAEPVEFRPEITLTKGEVLDLVANCDDVVTSAEEAGAIEVAFSVGGCVACCWSAWLGEPDAE